MLGVLCSVFPQEIGKPLELGASIGNQQAGVYRICNICIRRQGDAKREEDMLKDIPQQIADNAFDAVNELLSIERLSIAVYNEAAHRLEYASNPLEGVAENKLVWEDLMQRCFEEQKYLSEMECSIASHCESRKLHSVYRSVVFGEKQDAAGIRPFIAGVDSPLHCYCDIQCGSEAGNEIPGY